MLNEHALKDWTLFMAGIGAKEKNLCTLKNFLPHYFLR